MFGLQFSGVAIHPAPVATWTSAATVAQAIFGLAAYGGIVSGNSIYGEASTSTDFTSPFDTETATISNGDLIDLVLEAFAFAPFTDGTKYCRFCIKNGNGTQISYWSNTISLTIAVPPVLSSPTDVETGQTTASADVTTDTAEGTLYCVVTTSATPPTKAQVKAGQDNSGAAATFADDLAITTTGIKSFSVTGLTLSTAYTAHFMHEDVAGNQSTVATGDGFTTSAVPATWNPSDKDANITLSNGDLTATAGAGVYVVRATGSASTGKKYWEITVAASFSGNMRNGIANASQSLTIALGGGTSSHNSVGFESSGTVYENGGSIGTGNSYTTINKIAKIAVDLTAKKIWVKVDSGNWNNDASANPATGTNGFSFASIAAGPYYPAMSSNSPGPHTVTANFGATAFNSAAPSGFGTW